MNKLALMFAGIFSLITVLAIATDFMRPEGFSTTPQIRKEKNIRERSVYTHGGHRGFMHGK
ncbi:MAG TPA: hypothetical protein PLK28_01610 [Candidatus Rifleibacterium sp.]|jgi:hypothetical protein|nr:hypothetical protein [Candidatus Rifleibacterium sp.]HOI89185.1 hypothetical protein [Candidatus Rifleibacterium sp.]HPW58109.1 hypothetical protein [Candidatus Rifleibacterium sp.]HQB83531.1 hypothetical protein [Candidatus Rifleibacterium sp.]